MASIVASYPPVLDGNALFGFYLINFGGPSGPLSGGSGPSAPTGLTTGSGPGSSLFTGGGTAGGLASALFGVIRSPATLAPSGPARPSNGQLLTLPSSFDPSTNAGAVHNNGPIGTLSNVPGYGTAFSSGGSFAASYVDTYNGFATNPIALAVAGNAEPRAPMNPGANEMPGNGQPIDARYYQNTAPPNPYNAPAAGNGPVQPFGNFTVPVPTPFGMQSPGMMRP
ncbi:MAG TPA: hypothetical protein VGY53_05715, partial [Isosphaeraceae bacterium]|nr:hypothetical protein [Isosphaeraceae bacterium]